MPQCDSSPGRSLIAQLKANRDLTLPLIGVADADVRFSTERVELGPLQAGRAAASIALHEGQLLLDIADLTLPDGSSGNAELAIQGSLTIPNYTARGQFNDIDLSTMTAALAGMPLLKGKGQTTFDLRASGGSGIDVVSRLNGRVDVAMPRGGTAMCSIKGLSSGTQSFAADGCKPATVLEPFNASVAITNGIVKVDQVELYAASGDRIRLNGTVDLVTSIMDLTASASPPAEAGGSDAVAAAPPVHDVVAVRGRPESPTIQIRQP